MEITAENTELWSFIAQLGVVSILLLVSNTIRTRIKFIKKWLMPTAVLAGFLLLFLRSTGLLNIETKFLETLTYHGIGLGFIALSLRVKKKSGIKEAGEGLLAVKNGAVIVGSYIVQAITGLIITIGLSYTFMPDMFRAAGVLLPMAYGQGPGQANNIGSSYESLGFVGGRSFGLALAAAGFLCACIVGVCYLNILKKKSEKNKTDFTHKVTEITTDTFQCEGEIPIAESVDKFSVQMGLVLSVYAVTYGIMYAATTNITKYAPSMESLLNPLIMGFNFMIGIGVAMLVATIFAKLREKKVIKYQYQNNYLLNRISGYAFDLMIIAGIGSINIGEIQGLWVPFLLISILGGVTTFIFLRLVSKSLYKGYEEQGFVSMFGMMTGTVSSGILLLREIDPLYESPAANNLITGSGTGILLALPVLLLVGMAPRSPMMPLAVVGLAAIYLAILCVLIFKVGKKKG